MPHCPSELYDNVLWSFWDELAVSHSLIIFETLCAIIVNHWLLPLLARAHCISLGYRARLSLQVGSETFLLETLKVLLTIPTWVTFRLDPAP
jgi:hypothetical protein